MSREQYVENKALKADINVIQQECAHYEEVIEEQKEGLRARERAKEDELDRLIRQKEEELARMNEENGRMKLQHRQLEHEQADLQTRRQELFESS